MDEIHYEKVPRGNQLRLIKHLPAANVSAESKRLTNTPVPGDALLLKWLDDHLDQVRLPPAK